jgi:N-acetylneuraminic acid mutarotase
MKTLLLIFLLPVSVFADYWTQLANFPGPGRQVPTCFVINNMGYVGCGIGNSGYMNDFWKYDPLSNTWTQIASLPAGGRYGAAGWAINNKGYVCTGESNLNDFWEYDPTLNSWTQLPDFPGTPRGRSGYFSIGNKGYLGCGTPTLDDLWEWDQLTNVWTQKSSLPIGRVAPVGFSVGDKGYIATGYGGGFLSDLWEFDTLANTWTQKTSLPASGRIDASAFTICDKGYVGTGGEGPYYDDFWQYDLVINQWLQKANVPGGPRDDCAYFSIGNKGYLGLGQFLGSTYALDWWEYTPDSTPCFLTAGFTAPNHICPGTCIDFTNTSSGGIVYQWYFEGANPDTSYDVSPSNICYPTPGTYDVQLLAVNGALSDTFLLMNYITVYPTPPPQGIQQNGDTLFSNAGAASYQWYFNGNIISGATDYFYVATTSGDYNVVATDQNGCEVEAVINDVVAKIQLAVGNMQLAIFPNPVAETLTFSRDQLSGTVVEISIYNVLGETVQIQESRVKTQEETIDVSKLKSGLYYLEVISGENIYRTKFIKE